MLKNSVSFLIDFDNVLADTLGGFLRVLNERKGLNIKSEDVKQYNVEKALLLKGINELWKIPEIYNGVDIDRDALVFINWLKDHHIPYKIESVGVSDATVEVKKQILLKNGIENFEFFTCHTNKNYSKYSYVIEDNPCVLDCDFNYVYMVKKPYNKGRAEGKSWKYINRLSDIVRELA